MGLFVKAAAAFAVALAIAKGLLLVGESGSRELALGVAMILVASVVLWMTIDHWPKWLFGFCCANVLRCAGMGLIGRTFSYPSMTLPGSSSLSWPRFLRLLRWNCTDLCTQAQISLSVCV